MLIKGLQLGRDPKRFIGDPLETKIRGKQARQTKYQMANAKLHPARLFGRWLSGKPGAVQLDDGAKSRAEFLQNGSSEKVLDLQKESGAQIVDDRNRFDAAGGQIQRFATVSHRGMR